jgi:hypothetical protein
VMKTWECGGVVRHETRILTTRISDETFPRVAITG